MYGRCYAIGKCTTAASEQRLFKHAPAETNKHVKNNFILLRLRFNEQFLCHFKENIQSYDYPDHHTVITIIMVLSRESEDYSYSGPRIILFAIAAGPELIRVFKEVFAD
jgi:hypothetical protein